jgi:hypothetical protein
MAQYKGKSKGKRQMANGKNVPALPGREGLEHFGRTRIAARVKHMAPDAFLPFAFCLLPFDLPFTSLSPRIMENR